MSPEHSHARSSDEAGKVIIPGWLKTTVTLFVAIVVGTIASLNWMDSRYASKADIASVSGKLDDMQGDLKDIKRSLFERRSR